MARGPPRSGHPRRGRVHPGLAGHRGKGPGIPDRVIYYQYRHDRARRTLRGIDEQVAKAENAVAGKAPVKRNRYIKLFGATKSVNRDLETKTRALAGLKGYTTNLTGASAEFVIAAYHQLWRIEKSFRIPKHDLQARTVYHHKRVDRGSPEHRVCSTGGQPLDREPNKLEHQEIRPHHAPLPNRRSVPDNKPSPPPTPYPTTSATPLPKSPPRAARTNLAEVG